MAIAVFKTCVGLLPWVRLVFMETQRLTDSRASRGSDLRFDVIASIVESSGGFRA